MRRARTLFMVKFRSLNQTIDALPPGQRALITLAIVLPALLVTFLAVGHSLEAAAGLAIAGSIGGAVGGAVGRPLRVRRQMRRAERNTGSP
jgi:membrane associated rhomboid family serine protease